MNGLFLQNQQHALQFYACCGPIILNLCWLPGIPISFNFWIVNWRIYLWRNRTLNEYISEEDWLIIYNLALVSPYISNGCCKLLFLCGKGKKRKRQISQIVHTIVIKYKFGEAQINHHQFLYKNVFKKISVIISNK
jgi:hypothetical protein